jgi:agmatine/peptidylarginine deiminase
LLNWRMLPKTGDALARNALDMNPSHIHQPAEWERHSACWLAWPDHGHLWRENLGLAQAEFAALCAAIAEDGGEALELLVPDDQAETEARAALVPVLGQVRFHRVPVGDIWLRDTAPIFVKTRPMVPDGPRGHLLPLQWLGRQVRFTRR